MRKNMAIRPPLPLRLAALTIGFVLPAFCGSSAGAGPAPQIAGIDGAAQDFTVARVAGPFDHPWSMAFLPGGQMLVSERWGELKLVTPGTGEQLVISGTPPRPTEDHAGLMDVILDPDFATNRTIFLTHAHGDRQGATVRVLKAQLNLESRALENARTIYESAPPPLGLEEFGGRMVIDSHGYLFVTLGDRYDRRRAQDRSDAHGSIIRLNRDGSIPGDNPFVGMDGIRPEIWTYGHRNPQGLAIDPASGVLWAHEHGPMGGDELNIIERGRNYGWPLITYGTEYDGTPINNGLTQADGMEQPVHYWVPSIAPSGLAIYTGPVHEWRGTMWLGGLVGQVLVRLTLENGVVLREERFLKDQLGRIRDVRIGPDGFIYFSIDDAKGEIFRIEPKKKQAARSKTQ
jgi:glucose/arabinose dehydrogenase